MRDGAPWGEGAFDRHHRELGSDFRVISLMVKRVTQQF